MSLASSALFPRLRLEHREAEELVVEVLRALHEGAVPREGLGNAPALLLANGWPWKMDGGEWSKWVAHGEHMLGEFDLVNSLVELRTG